MSGHATTEPTMMEKGRGWWARTEAEYAHGEHRPLGSFLGLLGGYGTMVAGMAALARARGDRLPHRVKPGDLLLLGVATHKLARLIAKDAVTSPLRAPFTRFSGSIGEAELAEEVRGTGFRKAMGELVTCPFCVGQWVATGFTFGLVVAPRATRLAAAVFAELALSDFLQLGYAAAQQAQQGMGSD